MNKLPINVTRHRTQTIMDGLVIRYEFAANWPNTPEVNASRNGVGLSGSWPILKDLSRLLAVLELARMDYEMLRDGREPEGDEQ